MVPLALPLIWRVQCRTHCLWDRWTPICVVLAPALAFTATVMNSRRTYYPSREWQHRSSFDSSIWVSWIASCTNCSAMGLIPLSCITSVIIGGEGMNGSLRKAHVQQSISIRGGGRGLLLWLRLRFVHLPCRKLGHIIDPRLFLLIQLMELCLSLSPVMFPWHFCLGLFVFAPLQLWRY